MTTKNATDDLPTFSAKGAGQLLDLSARTITFLAQAGKLPHVRDSSGRRLYRQSDLEKYRRDREARRSQLEK